MNLDLFATGKEVANMVGFDLVVLGFLVDSLELQSLALFKYGVYTYCCVRAGMLLFKKLKF